MKRQTILLTLTLMLGLSIRAQQSWDFTKTPDSDVAALSSATTQWSYDSSKNRYESMVPINGAIKAGNTELLLTQGLTVVADAKKIRIDVNNRLQLAGKNIPLSVPGLKAGQVVTVVLASTGDNAVTFNELTNLSGTSGFTAADKNTVQTGTGTVTADGTVTFNCTGGSLNVFSITVSEAPEGGEQPGTDVYHNVARSTTQNQAVLQLKDGTTMYYNTDDLTAIDFANGNNVLFSMKNQQQDQFKGTVEALSFTKKQGGDTPPVVIQGDIEITEARGWFESLYAKWTLLEGAKSYNVYVKGGQYADFTKLDDQLVRSYATYGRADAVGLTAGSYELKVVAVDADGNELAEKSSTVSNLDVRNYPRQGFAFMNGYSPGAYKSDGTLKTGAKVFYVTAKTAKTITTTVAGAQQNPCVGLQAIIEAYEKGGDQTPIAFRFLGLVTKDDLDYIGSSAEGIQVKGRRADSELNLTFEGIGDDATLRGFGFLLRNAKSVEFRNIAVMRCMDDGISLDTDNSNIWIHHVDMFYGKHGSGDHDKGDGALDAKSDTKYTTVSYCHFWDTGKTNMFGMKDETGPNYISYDHNWFDHSDSRHPRVRTMTVHVWNNYFDNVAKYGVGATTGSSVFVENNYFLKTKKPILNSLQGTDALGSGTFSNEQPGFIKAYGNYFDRSTPHFSYYTHKGPAATGYDAYQADSRDEQIPAAQRLTAFVKRDDSGKIIAEVNDAPYAYDNFDTDATLMYQYTPDAAADVPALVTGYWGAGRLNHGDFQYTFPDNVGDDDADSAYDSTLGAKLDNYKTQLAGFFGEEQTPDNPDDPDDPDNPEVPEGTILATFDGSPSNSMFTVVGDYGDGKVTYDGTYYKRGVKLNSKGSITFTVPQTGNYTMTLVLAASKSGRDVNINGVTSTVGGTLNTEGAYYQLEPITLTAGTTYVLTKGTAESIVMVIKLEPAS